jgi:hypothetical protein
MAERWQNPQRSLEVIAEAERVAAEWYADWNVHWHGELDRDQEAALIRDWTESLLTMYQFATNDHEPRDLWQKRPVDMF